MASLNYLSSWAPAFLLLQACYLCLPWPFQINPLVYFSSWVSSRHLLLSWTCSLGLSESVVSCCQWYPAMTGSDIWRLETDGLWWVRYIVPLLISVTGGCSASWALFENILPGLLLTICTPVQTVTWFSRVLKQLNGRWQSSTDFA